MNEELLREGLAKKDPKWTKHGLLPWQFPYQQCRQANLEVGKNEGKFTN